MRTIGRVALAALGAASVGLLVLAVLPGGDTPGRAAAILQLVIGGAAIVATYLGLATALRIAEINDIFRLVHRRLRR